MFLAGTKIRFGAFDEVGDYSSSNSNLIPWIALGGALSLITFCVVWRDYYVPALSRRVDAARSGLRNGVRILQQQMAPVAEDIIPGVHLAQAMGGSLWPESRPGGVPVLNQPIGQNDAAGTATQPATSGGNPPPPGPEPEPAPDPNPGYHAATANGGAITGRGCVSTVGFTAGAISIIPCGDTAEADGIADAVSGDSVFDAFAGLSPSEMFGFTVADGVTCGFLVGGQGVVLFLKDMSMSRGDLGASLVDTLEMTVVGVEVGILGQLTLMPLLMATVPEFLPIAALGIVVYALYSTIAFEVDNTCEMHQ